MVGWAGWGGGRAGQGGDGERGVGSWKPEPGKSKNRPRPTYLPWSGWAREASADVGWV
jgi:hypothetical protein